MKVLTRAYYKRLRGKESVNYLSMTCVRQHTKDLVEILHKQTSHLCTHYVVRAQCTYNSNGLGEEPSKELKTGTRTFNKCILALSGLETKYLCANLIPHDF